LATTAAFRFSRPRAIPAKNSSRCALHNGNPQKYLAKQNQPEQCFPQVKTPGTNAGGQNFQITHLFEPSHAWQRRPELGCQIPEIGCENLSFGSSLIC
jgi:hypothetical protein